MKARTALVPQSDHCRPWVLGFGAIARPPGRGGSGRHGVRMQLPLEPRRALAAERRLTVFLRGVMLSILAGNGGADGDRIISQRGQSYVGFAAAVEQAVFLDVFTHQGQKHTLPIASTTPPPSTKTSGSKMPPMAARPQASPRAETFGSLGSR